MRRDETKPNDGRATSADTTKALRTKSGTSWFAELLITPAWATEQIEHSWLGSLELSVWTWTAWTMPVKVTSRIQIKVRPADTPLRDLCLNEIKRDYLLQHRISATRKVRR
jgi:hypothetical protein